MAGPRKTPKYKQPLKKGLSKAQQISALRKNMGDAKAAEQKSSGKKGTGGFRLGVRTRRSNLVDNRFLHGCLAKSRFQENQVLAEKLLRIRDDIKQHFDIPEEHAETLDNVILRLKKAEIQGLEKKVVLAPHQAEIVEKYFRLV